MKLIIIILNIFLSISIYAGCYTLTKNTSSYLVCNEKKDWQSAQDYCLSNNMNLITINDYMENSYIVNKIAQTNYIFSEYWIGLNDIDTEGTFIWSDDTIPSYWNKSSNYYDEILNRVYDCYYISSSDYQWYIYRCNEPMFFVCETYYNSEDTDNDGIINELDNCPDYPDFSQLDSDNNGIGDVCEDYDNDTIINFTDNCPDISNSDQLDFDKDGIGDVCDYSYCSTEQSTGECPGNTICDFGICIDIIYECSPYEINGVCYDGMKCYNGTCEDIYHECSFSDSNGYCDNGLICDAGICKEPVFICSKDHLNGFCEYGSKCVNGKCKETSSECSSLNPHGTCLYGEHCDGGECVEVLYSCSQNHPNGVCDEWFECRNGVCVEHLKERHVTMCNHMCSFSAAETRQCLVSTEIFMLFIMMIGLYIKRKSLKTK